MLNYRLLLKKGIINTSSAALLTLGAVCKVDADTLSGEAFINGPLKKTGMSSNDFVFPVGKGAAMRWLALTNSSGDFTVEYFNDDPYQIATAIGYGLDHISHLEYWNITGSGPAGSVKLSFADPASGGVTNLADLRVSKLVDSKWEDLGNSAVGGNAGKNGWVSSFAASGFSAGKNYFALASAAGQENPLPLSGIILKAGRISNAVQFEWHISRDTDLREFELQASDKSGAFVTVWTERSYSYVSDYSHSYYPAHKAPTTFRIKATDQKGDNQFSNLVPWRYDLENSCFISGPSIEHSKLMITITSPSYLLMNLAVYDAGGILVKRFSVSLSEGNSSFDLDVSQFPRGMYYVKGFNASANTNVFRFVRI